MKLDFVIKGIQVTILVKEKNGNTRLCCYREPGCREKTTFLNNIFDKRKVKALVIQFEGWGRGPLLRLCWTPEADDSQASIGPAAGTDTQ